MPEMTEDRYYTFDDDGDTIQIALFDGLQQVGSILISDGGGDITQAAQWATELGDAWVAGKGINNDLPV